MEFKRIDILLKEKGLVKSRELAKKAISKNLVKYNDNIVKKVSLKVPIDANIELINSPLKYVSCAGYKLEKAINCFDINLKGKIAMDMGASTGGFTDCMLKNKINKVYAVDVGYNQLDENIIKNPNVINMEKTNIRYLDPDKIKEKIDFISIDVSFISLTKILLVAKQILKDNGEIIALIKPQFEAGKQLMGKKGVIKDKKVHLMVINKIKDFLETINLYLTDICYSPVKGGSGNIEFLAYITSVRPKLDIDKKIEEIIDESHEM